MKELISRERLFRLMEQSKGRFFGLRYINKYGEERVVNAKFINQETPHRNQDKIFGYTTLWLMPNKLFIRVSNRNLVSGTFNHTEYIATRGDINEHISSKQNF